VERVRAIVPFNVDGHDNKWNKPEITSLFCFLFWTPMKPSTPKASFASMNLTEK
jgi:hypothetical protein